ncbi:HEAT repeat domain-containing protein [Natrialbaceae archaeon GCM10025810]
MELREQALTDPEEVELEELAEILSNPVVPPAAHGAAIVALLNVARVRDDIGEAFVEDLGRVLGRPSLNTALVLRCLRQLAVNDPEAVLALRDEIVDRISIESTDVTQAATGCCVELIATNPVAFVDQVPTLATLLDSENDQVQNNAVYILSQVAHEYPEEVKPVVPQLIDDIGSREQPYQINALSALGAVTSAYPAAGVEATDTIAELVASNAPAKVRANAVGLLGDIAVGHPAELEEHVPLLVDCIQSDDEYLSGNASAALLHVAIDDSEAVEEAIPALIELLDDPSPVVRRNVCKALGHVEATVALEQLKTMAESDPDEEVRSIAAWAAENIT